MHALHYSNVDVIEEGLVVSVLFDVLLEQNNWIICVT